MKYKNTLNSLALTLAFATTAFSANAENALHLGDGVNLLAVNGKELSSDSLFGNKSGAHPLPNGINQIAVNYVADIKDELEYSNVFVLLFESSDKELTLRAPEIKRMRELEQFESNKNWLLTNNAGSPVSFKASLIKRDGFQLSRDYEDELEDFNQSGAEAALPQQVFSNAQITSTTQIPGNNNKKSSKGNMAAQMLIYWYNQADEATRKSFKELINNQ